MAKITCVLDVPDAAVNDIVAELTRNGDAFLASLLVSGPAGSLCRYELDELVIKVRERPETIIT